MDAGGDRPTTTESNGDFPSKPGTSDTQDVFRLTGTTFAGASDMGGTAGPSDTRPSTEGTWHPMTRPQTVGGLAISAIGEEGSRDDMALPSPSTEQHNRLLMEAEMRAEHQIAARKTMLDLAEALDIQRNKARELVVHLRAEQDANVVLRGRIGSLEAEIEALHQGREDREVETMRFKFLSHYQTTGSTMLFSMLLEKSQEAAALGLRSFDFAVLGADKKPADVSKATPATGEKITLKWLLKWWCREAEGGKAARAKAKEEEEWKRKMAELEKRIRAEYEAKLEGLRKIIKGLEEEQKRLMEIISGHKAVTDRLERELREAKERAAREASAAKAREEALKAELVEVKQEVERVKAALADLQIEYEAAQEALRRADEAFAAERSKLQNIIRQISSELQEAMVIAKHMRETALKAKRDAASSISPSKFAELIAQLEGMRSQLSIYAKECAVEKEKNAWLSNKLNKDQRQLELERQFLPLLRKVRGPVGPKAKGAVEEGGKVAVQVPQNNMMPPLTAGTSPGKLRMSQSMSALNDVRAQTAGGPLPGARSSQGFLDDQTRFASSLGFASSSGQGTPIRG